MRFLLCSTLTLSLFSGLSLTSLAQTTPPAAAPATTTEATPLLKPGLTKNQPYKKYLYQRYAGDEQATRVIRLFARRQTGGKLWLGTGAVVIGFVASQTGTKTSSNGGTTTTTVTPLGYGLMLGLFGGVSISKLARYSNEKLYQELSGYDRDHAFSPNVQAKID
ncbi:hypothetical protein KBK19_14645 [Microvirga sp. STR05]|uniref:Transmembrane protein n=1 Tax=Hymenobacter duratus TaxID=2771356 RepID=A0ABR8JLK0_9BACT|nr:hypothetical protein [Hymenobacter duratus]MBD2716275.1 hypothetical protein [Hymenobacter duratus]MBR7951191.1 hypothetical protein [Microvirga sp. STR05]